MRRILARTLALFVPAAAAVWFLMHTAWGAGSKPSAPEATPSTPVAHLPLVMNAQPTETPTPSATPDAAWLQHVNRFRETASLHPLAENAQWSEGAWLHSRYMVKEDHVSHSENPDSDWYSDEGDAAGRSGNIFVTSWLQAPDEVAVDFWMSGPFHAVAIIDPQLHETAFGSYRESLGNWRMGATLDWARGLGELPAAVSYPLAFPQPGGETWLTTHPGYEWPDPLTSCPGYTAPTGPPVILQLGSGDVTPEVTAHSFTRQGTALSHCVFDETTYANPSASTQNSGRLILDSRDAVILMPQDPLQQGETYTVSITANRATFTWHFSVIDSPGPSYTVPRDEAHFEVR